MDETSEYRLTSALLCDDIRVEFNGKIMLIGVYTGDILVPSFPVKLAVSAFLQYEPAGTGTTAFSARYANGEEPLAAMNGEVGFFENAPLTIALPPALIDVAEPTELSLQVSLNQEPLTTVLRKRVLKAPPPALQ